MTTAVVDNEQRVRIPNLRPGEVVAYPDNGDDTITLTKVNAEAGEPFPEGSLREYVDDWNKEFGAVEIKLIARD